MDAQEAPVGGRAALRVHVPSSEAELDQVRDLMRAFVGWHRERHVEDRRLIDDYFDADAFAAELAALPGDYAEPAGCLLLATVGEEPAGCVALKRIDDGSCEMKRMFVLPRFQGRGVGRALAREVIEAGARLGYSSMWLDTSVRQAEAQALYQSLGFEIVPAYYDLPDDLRNWLVFMRKDLRER